MLVADLELQPVACAGPSATIAEAAVLFVETRRDVFVVETNPLTEMTHDDLVAAIAEGAAPDTPVSDLPLGAPQFVTLGTNAEAAAATMIVLGRAALVVVEGGRPCGLLTLRTVAGALWGATSWLGAFRVALRVEEL